MQRDVTGEQGDREGQYRLNKEHGYGRAAIPVPQTGFKGPIPTSTSSPAPTIYGLGGPLRRIVGALESCLGRGIVASLCSSPHFFSIGSMVRRLAEGVRVRVIDSHPLR